MKQLTGTHSEKVAALKKLEETNKNLEIDVEELNVRCVERSLLSVGQREFNC